MADFRNADANGRCCETAIESTKGVGQGEEEKESEVYCP
jgi:hypothetical protein